MTAALLDVPTDAPVPLKRRALYGLQRAMQWSGAGAAYVRMAKVRGAVILMYHSVPAADAAPWIDPRNALSPVVFREQMEFLASRRRVVSMSALVEAIESGETLPPGTVALTFDDGYRDNLTVVAPVLAELSLPAVLYLPTGYVARSENQWVDRLYGSFRARTRQTLEIADGAGAGSWRLDDAGRLRAAYDALCRALIEATWEERERCLLAIETQLAPSARAPRMTMSWDDVRTLVSKFPSFEVGAHTVDHLDLHAREAATCRDQVLRCAQDIERETARRAAHFSFPYARSSPESRRIVAECGFSSAVTSGDDVLLGAGADVHALPRVETPRSRALFRFWTSGAYPALPRLVTGRA